MNAQDEELTELMNRWQSAPVGAPLSLEGLRRHVRRRRLQLIAWIVGELVVGIAGTAVLVAAVATTSRPLERLSLAALLVVLVGALAFSWWNWRGALGAVGESTAVFVEVSRLRLARVRRALRVGWGMLVAEGLLFIPFVWERSGGATPTVVWPWFFLAGMLALVAAALVAASRAVGRERAMLDAVERDADGA